MQKTRTTTTSPWFRPVARILALEPRLLYDGAGAAAVSAEHQPEYGEAAEAHEAGWDGEPEGITGEIGSELQSVPAALVQFEDLPTLSLTDESGQNPVDGKTVIRVTFTKPPSQAGGVFFIDSLVPASGVFGSDGLSFRSASMNGKPVCSYMVPVGADGTAQHPLAHDEHGNSVVVPAFQYGYQSENRLVVLEFPEESLRQAQPEMSVDMVFRMDRSADICEYTVSFRAGRIDLQLGEDSQGNLQQESTRFQADWQVYTLCSVAEERSVETDEWVLVSSRPDDGQSARNGRQGLRAQIRSLFRRR